MLPNFISHKHPQVSVDILFDSRYLNADGVVTCCPGSVFEGSVKVKTRVPIPVSHIKIVFKATGMLFGILCTDNNNPLKM